MSITPPSNLALPFAWGEAGCGYVIVDEVDGGEIPQGRSLHASSVVAREVTDLLKASQRLLSERSLVRIVSNDGSHVPLDALTDAVGGFAAKRAMVHGPKGIRENVRLVRPDSAKGLSAAFPLMTLSVVLDMVAEAEQAKQIEAIKAGVDWLVDQQRQERIARIRACSAAFDSGAAKLIDEGLIGPENGLDSARQDSRVLYNLALGDLVQVEKAVRSLGNRPQHNQLHRALKANGVSTASAEEDSVRQLVHVLAVLRASFTLERRGGILELTRDHANDHQGTAFMDLALGQMQQQDDAFERLLAVEDQVSAWRLSTSTVFKIPNAVEFKATMRTSEVLSDLMVAIAQQRAAAAARGSQMGGLPGGLSLQAIREPHGELHVVA